MTMTFIFNHVSKTFYKTVKEFYDLDLNGSHEFETDPLIYCDDRTEKVVQEGLRKEFNSLHTPSNRDSSS